MSSISQLSRLRSLRGELEKHVPLSELAKWHELFSTFRVAGEPRAVSILRKALLLADFSADEHVPQQLRELARKGLEKIRTSAALLEIVWLDEEEVSQFITNFRTNQYQGSQRDSWKEDRTKKPRPYNKQLPVALWRSIRSTPPI
jgi:CHAD domain-containing protein